LRRRTHDDRSPLSAVVSRVLPTATLVLAAACSPAAGPPGASPDVWDAASAAASEGDAALAEGDADSAAEAFRRAADLAAGDASLDGWRRVFLYNAACSEARRGRTAEALAAFRASLEDGLPVFPVVLADGAAGTRSLTLEHVLADPDLDSIRGAPEFTEVLAPFLAAGTPVVSERAGTSDAPRPAVIVLRGDGGTEVAGVSAEWDVEGVPPWIAVALAGPVRRGDGRARWLLDDGDDRAAVTKVREALDLCARDPRVDPSRVFVAGEGPDAADAAWAASLAFPDRVAGLLVSGARFLRAADEDALAAAVRARGDRPWTVVVGAEDEDLAAALAAHEIEPVRVARLDAFPVTALALWLGRRPVPPR